MAESRTPQTNIEFVTEIMDFARSGPLMQPFVIEALIHYSRLIDEKPIEEFQEWSFINPVAWKACAAELRKALEAKYG